MIRTDISKQRNCDFCESFGRPRERKKPVQMILASQQPLISAFPQLPDGLRICRDCLRNMASKLKRSTKK
jgi:hypothetical protein